MKDIYISSNAFPERSLDAVFDTCDRLGIDAVELGSGIRHDPDARRKILDESKRRKILLHNYILAPEKPFVLNLASSNAEVVRKSMRMVSDALHLSAEIAAPVFGVHAGFAYEAEPSLLGQKQSDLPHIALENAERIFAENVRRLSEIAREAGVRLLIENNEVSARNLVDGANRRFVLAGLADTVAMMGRVAPWGVGILLDVGHLKVSATNLEYDKKEFMDRVGAYIGAFHLSDNDGHTDQHLPISGESWFLDALSAFPDDVPVTLETNGRLEETIASKQFITS